MNAKVLQLQFYDLFCICNTCQELFYKIECVPAYIKIAMYQIPTMTKGLEKLFIVELIYGNYVTVIWNNYVTVIWNKLQMYVYAKWTKIRQYKSIVSSTYSFCYSMPYLVLILEANNSFRFSSTNYSTIHYIPSIIKIAN